MDDNDSVPNMTKIIPHGRMTISLLDEWQGFYLIDKKDLNSWMTRILSDE